MTQKILLVDDDPQALASTQKILRFSGEEVLTAVDGKQALEVLQKDPACIDLVVSDVRMPKMGGLEFLQALHICHREIPVILMTAYGQIHEAVWAMKFGAVDFLAKPFKRETLLQAVKNARKRLRSPQVQAQGQSAGGASTNLVAESAQMKNLLKQLARVAPTRSTILINGESGTGKELLARELHALSPQNEAPFVAINCAAIPENLLESELFGYEKGAFSGAFQAKPGLIESAAQGILFLDEIGDMPINLQSKLLRVLQSGEVRRLGSSQSQQIDVRVVSATHRDLRALVSQGKFREDLLFRLDVVSLWIPPLRSRPEDVEALVQQCLARYYQLHHKQALRISDQAWACLRSYNWPGNVRELMNVIERAVIFCEGGEISKDDLPVHVQSGEFSSENLKGVLQVPLGIPLKDVEDLVIQRTLEAADGNKNIAARILGINSRTIQRRTKAKSETEDLLPPIEPSTPLAE